MHKPCLFGEFGSGWRNCSVSIYMIAGQMWQPNWPAISAVLRSTLSPCQEIGILLGLGYHAKITAPRTKRALHTLELTYNNKANLRDLIAATGLVILLKLDSNCQFFNTCDLEIWWMILENNRALLLYYVKLCVSLQIHQWIQTGVRIQKCSIRVKIGNFLSLWPWNLTDHLEKQ